MANRPDRDDADDEREDAARDADDEDTDDEDARPAPAKKTAKPAPAAADDDDDDDLDDEEEEEDEEDEPPPPPPKKAVAKAKPAVASAVPVKKRKRPGPELPDERVIDAPKKQTLYMLGVLAFAILAMWITSRLACNVQGTTRKPREVSTADLARDPKGAALELAQRWSTADYAGALELAKGPIAEQIKKDQAECEKDKPACDKKREELKDQVLATAVLLSREGEKAKARVSTSGGPGGKDAYVLELEREGALWKGVSRSADTGAPPAPAPSPTPPPSAAPAESAPPAPAPSP